VYPTLKQNGNTMLETEIKKLTSAIDRLSELLIAGQSITITDDGVLPDKTPDKAAAVDFDALREEAKNLCLTLVRDNRDNKKLIAAYLAGCAAKTITQLADENLDGFIASMRVIKNAK